MHGADSGDNREAVMWLGVQHTHKKALAIFSRELAPAGTGMGRQHSGQIYSGTSDKGQTSL